MTEQVYLGIDVGLASVRAGIFDAKGQRLAFAVRALAQAAFSRTLCDDMAFI